MNRLRTLLAAVSIIATVGVLSSGCESNQSYTAARIGLRIGTEGEVEVVSFSCGTALPTVLKVDPYNQERSLWRAATSSPPSGLVVVPADGRNVEGWTVSGSVDATSSERLEASVYLGGEIGWQTAVFIPKELTTGDVTVETGSFGGRDHVSEGDFIKVNQGWCAEGR